MSAAPEMSLASKQDQERGKEIVRGFKRAVEERSNYESLWYEIGVRVWPNYTTTFAHGSQTGSVGGGKKTQELYDSTAAMGLTRFGAIMDSLLTPRNQKWHKIIASDPSLNKQREVRTWFEQVNDLLYHYRYLPEANFASQNQITYKSTGAFGTGCTFVDQLWGAKGLRYRSIPLSELYVVENHQGQIDKIYRAFTLTARQAIQKWGAKVPAKIREAADSSPNRLWVFVHCVEPRTEGYDRTKADFRGMKWASTYVFEDDGSIMQDGGYRTFPYATSRYEQAPNESYGRGVAADLLPAIKTLNEQKKTMLKAGHRAVDPVYLMADDGVADVFSAKPGSAVAGGVNADGRPLVHALQTGRFDIGRDLMEDERNTIKDGFLVSLFQILTENPQQTATEVIERAKEKGILLAPTMGRVASEYLGPMIVREVDVLDAQGLLPPKPQVLLEAGVNFKVEYDSPLSRAQRAEEAAGLMRTVEYALQVVQATQDPTPLDYFDWDTITPEIADINGVPFRWIKSIEDVQAMRAGRQQQQAVETAIQAAPGAAAMMKAAQGPGA